jgi:LuxR family transcriptional regulator, maltose regulon positive regulatory protein
MPAPPPWSDTDLPAADRLTLPRPRLMTRLDAASRGSRVVVVESEAGSGKTSTVASWAHQTAAGTGICWRDLRGGGDLVAILDSLPAELATAPSDRGLRVVGHPRPSSARGASSSAARPIIVLDDFPVDPGVEAAAALERLVHRVGHRAVLVLVCSAPPALDLQRLGVSAECRGLTSPDLALNQVEIAALLTRAAVEPTPALVRDLTERTSGWAWGVRLGASLLARSRTTVAALHETDLAIADYLRHSVLRDVPVPSAELLRATSMVADVSPDVAAAIVDDDRGLPEAVATQTRGFVRVRADGSFTVHPLLRRHLQNELRRRPSASRAAVRRAAECTAALGDRDAAISLAVDEADWTWAARALVESLHVPRLLASGRDQLLDRPGVADRLGAAEPMLLAAAALGRSWPETAALAVAGAAAQQEQTGASSPAAQLSDALVRMALARWEGDPERGLEQHRRAVALVPALSLAQRAAAPELAPVLQSHAGAFEAMTGAPERARVALERGARAFRPTTVPSGGAASVAAAACLGQLAWQEAVSGQLTGALRHASDVLAARPADSNEVGVLHAQLAIAWCEISRAEVDQAVQRVRRLTSRRSLPTDAALLPELTMATGLVTARLDAATGHGSNGDELDQVPPSMPCARQYEHQLRLLRAEQELDAAQPAAALELLADAPEHGADVQTLRARAWIQLGDLASAGESLHTRSTEALGLLTRLQIDLIEARLAPERGDRVRQRALIDRALRVARLEQLRAPIAWAKPWLLEATASDTVLLQRHGSFLAALRPVRLASFDGTRRAHAVTTPVSGLTEREIDILQRLGALSTNDEIAADLFLSPNTVKTHLKSLYRKLEVTRRSDAFRRGRALGLC